MTHRSLFKEVAQRIVQSAQSSQSDGSSHPLDAVRSAPGSMATASRPRQMTGSTFEADSSPLKSPTDTSPAVRR